MFVNNTDFLNGLDLLQEHGRLINENDTLEITLDDDLQYKFSEPLINYLMHIRNNAINSEITIERLRTDVNRIFGKYAAQLIDLFILAGVFKETTRIKIT